VGVIYSITFEGSRRSYIGSARHLQTRIKRHRYLLKHGCHHSILLQRASAKYGLNTMRVTILEHVAEDTLLIEREQHWIDAFSGKRYNRSPTAASRLGAKMSASARRKISASLVGNQYRTGIPHDPAIKEKIAASLRASYAEGRHRICANPQNLAAFNNSITDGSRKHPRPNAERDAAITRAAHNNYDLDEVALPFGIKGPAVYYALRRTANRLAESLAAASPLYAHVKCPIRIHPDWLELLTEGNAP
jgi:group I intron endonuclease